MKTLLFSTMISAAVLAAPATWAADITIRVGHTNAADSIQDMGLQKLRDLLEEKTDGQATIEIFPNGQIGDERELVEGVLLGTLDMAMVSNAVTSNFVNDFRVLDMPFLFTDIASLREALDGPAKEVMQRAARDAGLQLVGTYSSGIRHIMTNKPIETLADLEGMKIRTMQQPMHIETFRAFGANPTPLAYAELYGALQSGVVDGAEGAATNYLGLHFYEVADHYSLVGWINMAAHVFMSTGKFESLPENVQTALLEAGEESVAWQFQYVDDQEKPLLDELEAKDVNVVRPDVTPFQEAALPLYDTFIETESQRALYETLTAEQ